MLDLCNDELIHISEYIDDVNFMKFRKTNSRTYGLIYGREVYQSRLVCYSMTLVIYLVLQSAMVITITYTSGNEYMLLLSPLYIMLIFYTTYKDLGVYEERIYNT